MYLSLASRDDSQSLVDVPLSSLLSVSSGGRSSMPTKPSVDIDSLTPLERLQLIDYLWKSLSRASEAVPLSEAHSRELDQRLDELDAGESAGIPWQQVLDRIRRA
jgi:putative addiction module component (TIGR02574 family)